MAGKLGLIAGGGGLPVAIAEACRTEGRPYFTVRLKGMAEADLKAHPGEDVGLAELGRCLKALKAAGCEKVCFAGKVRRPDFAALRPDLKGLQHLPALMTAARQGDDALLRAVLKVFEAEGFEVEGVAEAGASLLLPPGPLGTFRPLDEELGDVQLAIRAAQEVGRTDVGQAAIARGGAVVAQETEDGTDAMLTAYAEGAPSGRGGVLAKMPKPHQDLRVDIPTIGVATVEAAAWAGLVGIVGQAGALLVVDPPKVRAAADRLRVFVYGLEVRAR
jgi:DUF1009 family protein